MKIDQRESKIKEIVKKIEDNVQDIERLRVSIKENWNKFKDFEHSYTVTDEMQNRIMNMNSEIRSLITENRKSKNRLRDKFNYEFTGSIGEQV